MFMLGGCCTVSSGLPIGCTGLVALPQGPKTPTGAQIVPPTGARRNLCGPYNWTMDGSRKPSLQVLRMVSCSSNGCQRTPTFGTVALVLLLNHSSYRTPAVNSSA